MNKQRTSNSIYITFCQPLIWCIFQHFLYSILEYSFVKKVSNECINLKPPKTYLIKYFRILLKLTTCFILNNLKVCSDSSPVNIFPVNIVEKWIFRIKRQVAILLRKFHFTGKKAEQEHYSLIILELIFYKKILKQQF